MKYYKVGEKVAIRQAFGETLIELAGRDKKIIAISADLGGSLTLDEFGAKYPDRYYNTGVAEQDMIGVAAGFALSGFHPFAGTFGAFLGRAMDHVRQSVCHNKLNVKIVGSHGGVSNAQDGPSAHALEDFAMFRALPNMVVVMPSDPNQTIKAVQALVKYQGPAYLRLYREPLPVFTTASTPFKIGKANLMRRGKDVTVVACGPHVGLVLEIAKEVNASLEIIDNHSLNPIDSQTIIKSAKKTGAVITVEDHSVNGGLGSSIAEVLVENYPVPMQRVGLRDFATTGSYEDVINYAGIGRKDIKKAINEVIDIKS